MYKHLFVIRSASTIPHIHSSLLQALPGRGYAGCLEGVIPGASAGDMQDPATNFREFIFHALR